MAYTQEGIMAQIWIAFGQGAGAIRVSHDAALELYQWYYDKITPYIIHERWQTDAVQVLDRMRAIGRHAAFLATRIYLALHNAPERIQAVPDAPQPR